MLGGLLMTTLIGAMILDSVLHPNPLTAEDLASPAPWGILAVVFVAFVPLHELLHLIRHPRVPFRKYLDCVCPWCLGAEPFVWTATPELDPRRARTPLSTYLRNGTQGGASPTAAAWLCGSPA